MSLSKSMQLTPRYRILTNGRITIVPFSLCENALLVLFLLLRFPQDQWAPCRDLMEILPLEIGRPISAGSN